MTSHTLQDPAPKDRQDKKMDLQAQILEGVQVHTPVCVVCGCNMLEGPSATQAYQPRPQRPRDPNHQCVHAACPQQKLEIHEEKFLNQIACIACTTCREKIRAEIIPVGAGVAGGGRPGSNDLGCECPCCLSLVSLQAQLEGIYGARLSKALLHPPTNDGQRPPMASIGCVCGGPHPLQDQLLSDRNFNPATFDFSTLPLCSRCVAGTQEGAATPTPTPAAAVLAGSVAQGSVGDSEPLRTQQLPKPAALGPAPPASSTTPPPQCQCQQCLADATGEEYDYDEDDDYSDQESEDDLDGCYDTGRPCTNHSHTHGCPSAPLPRPNHDFATARDKLRLKWLEGQRRREMEPKLDMQDERGSRAKFEPQLDDLLLYIEGQKTKPRAQAETAEGEPRLGKAAKRARKKQQDKLAEASRGSPFSSGSGEEVVGPATAPALGRKPAPAPSPEAKGPKGAKPQKDLPRAPAVKAKGAKAKVLAPSLAEDIFTPMDNLDGVDEHDREVEEFKRFVAAAVPAMHRERLKVNVNLSVLGLKTKLRAHQ